jgi:RNA polymerase sigma-70 factor (ECF subfamily)
VHSVKLPGERELIESAQQGSVSAFEKLVFHYQDRLYRFLLARAANRSDAEDALQESFAAAFKYLSGYKPRYQFSTWLFTIAIRKLYQSNRRQTEPLEKSAMVVCQQPGPEQQGIAFETRHSIWKTAKTCLNDPQFTALWLFYVEELPYREIGAAMNRPVSWVKVNLMRARRRLSRELREDKFEYTVSHKEVTL